MGKKKATPKAKNTVKVTPKVKPKQPKITKPAPKQGRGKETDVVEVEIKTQRFPFWARLRIGKNRPTLIIDETDIVDRKKQTPERGFVHREATHTQKRDYEEITPNPNPNDPKPMYLKRPDKKPKRLFSPMDKQWPIPENLQKRYEKNNNKDK